MFVARSTCEGTDLHLSHQGWPAADHQLLAQAKVHLMTWKAEAASGKQKSLVTLQTWKDPNC